MRAVATWTGITQILPPEHIRLDYEGPQELFRLHVLEVIGRACIALREHVGPARYHLHYVGKLAARLTLLIQADDKGNCLEELVDMIEEQHPGTLQEIYRDLPDPENYREVHDTLAALMWKYSKKAINAHRRQVAA